MLAMDVIDWEYETLCETTSQALCKAVNPVLHAHGEQTMDLPGCIRSGLTQFHSYKEE